MPPDPPEGPKAILITLSFEKVSGHTDLPVFMPAKLAALLDLPVPTLALTVEVEEDDINILQVHVNKHF